MIKVGITGQAGFIGTHLYNTLGLFPEEFKRIPFKDNFFDDENKLNEFVKSCDSIVHLAAMNRHENPDIIYETNIRLVKQLIAACENTKARPHILFSSSTQEERDNLYGKSKREGRKLLSDWALENNGCFTGLIIPNVFGPFGLPFYNSVVATFCHQLSHNEIPKINVDGTLKLIYVGELINEIIEHIIAMSNRDDYSGIADEVYVNHTAEISVSKLLKQLTEYKELYFENGIMPDLTNPFNRNLFNTFVCYIDHASFFPFNLKFHTDDRGVFVETIKLNSGGQVSFSTTKPRITRGNHFHTRKAERFAVIKGKARIELRRIGTNKILSFELDGSQPSFVDMPIWFTHNITNIGDEDVYTIFWINKHYDAMDADTFFEVV